MALTITKDLEATNGTALSVEFVTLDVKWTELDGFVKVKLNYYTSEVAARANPKWALRGIKNLPFNLKFDYSRSENGNDVQAFVNTEVKAYLVANTDLEEADIVVSEV